MKITVNKLPSGFYCVCVNGKWIDAASATKERAQKIVNEIVQRENKRQNKHNVFTNISVEWRI